MTDILITGDHVDEFIQKVRHLANKHPKAVYVRPGVNCLYNFGYIIDGPMSFGCIMGQAARLLDESNPIKRVIAKTDSTNNDRIGNLIRQYDPDWKIHRDDLEWLNCVQSGQDSGLAWGAAVTIADDRTFGVNDES